MVAYFSSKFTKQIQTALAVVLLMVCMMGTHWVGFAHSISHATFQQQSISQASSSEIAPVFSHSSDTCHLFDALTLAGFIPDASTQTLTPLNGRSVSESHIQLAIAQAATTAYQSRAPPSFIL